MKKMEFHCAARMLVPGQLSKSSFGFGHGHRPPPPPMPPTQNQLSTDAPLPIAKHRQEILYFVESHTTLILIMETGSGKTTQVPRYLLEAGWAAQGYFIACTQPRRQAAASIASRVAEELGCTLGTTVGYSVRFDSLESDATQIKFLTDGCLINEMLQDPLLTKYSVVIVDEAHERSLQTDMLLGLLKKVQRRRPDLRLIISSATLQAETFQAFFSNTHRDLISKTGPQNKMEGQPSSLVPAVLSTQGRTFPVEIHYLQSPASDYIKAAVTACVDIHTADLPGDILVFLTGQEECLAAVKMLDEQAERLSKSSGYSLKLLPVPLYSGLPGHQQRQALEPAPRGYRKVVIATSIAETSLTLPNVVYVVDSLFVKQRCYNPLLGLESLLVAPISKQSAQQRAGRAGRVRAGMCFRLATKEDYQTKLPEVTIPEMQRSDLTSMVLQLKSLGIDNVMRFEFISPPPSETLVRALETLHALRIIDDDGKLTHDIGLPVSDLPLDPPLGRLLIASGSDGCGEEAASICAILSVPPLWLSRGSRKMQDEAKAKFAAAEGDLVTYLNVLRGWRDHGRDLRWCERLFISHHSLMKAEEVRLQLEKTMRRLKIGLGSCLDSPDGVALLCKTISKGLFLNAACFDHLEYDPLSLEGDHGTNVYRLIRPIPSGQEAVRLRIHKSSVLHRSQPKCVVFASVQQSDDGWYEMMNVTSIESESLFEAAPHVFTRR
jgi:ATP-dependent RNA helicase DDX35